MTRALSVMRRSAICSPPPQLSSFFALTGVSSVGLLMASTTLTLTALSRLVGLGNEATNKALEVKYFEECFKWAKESGGFARGEPVPTPTSVAATTGSAAVALTFQKTWRAPAFDRALPRRVPNMYQKHTNRGISPPRLCVLCFYHFTGFRSSPLGGLHSGCFSLGSTRF